MNRIIRLTLTAAILYKVYTEPGKVWLLVCLVLMTLALELQS